MATRKTPEGSLTGCDIEALKKRIKVINITNKMMLDGSNEFTDYMIAIFTVDELGPFEERMPAKQFTREKLTENILVKANDICKLRALEL